ncbi:unnamed protein product [Lactuca saligna]|uniref:Aconitase/3-isopropylmalate dehydratase large subunit alpha/beta/alpha domain-containing protein n=1 Tax=Lactuca saligna TaxID=75948 RepID=A0AA35ZTN3_LACSI|nr:unnamed protein product [Lactuca saligna]
MALNEAIEKAYVDNLVDYVEVNRKEPVNNGMLLLLPKEELEDEASLITTSTKCRGSRESSTTIQDVETPSTATILLNCKHLIVRQFIVYSFRYWVTEMHVDGFRFDLASIMTRDSSLFDAINVSGNQVGIYFPCYDFLCNYMEEYSSKNAASMTPYIPLVAGSVARSLACITCYPIELARTRMQLSGVGVKLVGNTVWSTLFHQFLIVMSHTVAVAVLSGNRNFEGRVHPLTRSNYLASPPLVVAYALVCTVDIDFENKLTRPQRTERMAKHRRNHSGFEVFDGKEQC